MNKIDIYESTDKRPFGYLRNTDWWIFSLALGHEFCWIRVYPIVYGLEIKKKGAIKGLKIFTGWRFRLLRAKK